MIADIFEQYNYAVVIVLMMTGLYVVFSSRNLIKKLVGLSIFQTSVFLLYITISKVSGGQPPILEKSYGKEGGDYAVDKVIELAAAEGGAYGGYATDLLYSNPLPHVLILTAIVVGVATLSIGLALVVRARIMDITPYMPAWLFEHGAAFLIAVPLIMAAIMAVLPSKRLAWWTTTALTIILAVSALALAQFEMANGMPVYTMGGWAPPHGISLVIDALSAPVLLLIAAMAVVTMIYAMPATIAEIEAKKRAPFYAAFLLCMAGLMGMVITGDAFNVFVFLEVSSISTYVLVAMGASRDRRALVSAYNYLIMGSIGATFFVIGIGFLYMETGTLNMADMARILANLEGGSRVSMVAFGFIIVGLGLKLAMFPLHTWLPGAYAYSPTPVTTFLASTATKAALYLMIRFTFFVFNPEFDYVAATLTYLIVGLGVAGMLFASLQAIFQTDARRTLAFSSVAQVGYMLLGIGIATTASVAAGYLHLINHAIIKGGLFLAVGAMWYRFGITRTEDFRGLSKTMPWTMGAFMICGFSLIGVPFTAGFVSKVALAEAAAEQGYWWSVAIIMITSILAVIYIGRILMNAYFQNPPEVDGVTVARNEAPLMMLVPMWVLALSSIAIGMNIFGASDIIVSASERASELMLSAGG